MEFDGVHYAQGHVPVHFIDLDDAPIIWGAINKKFSKLNLAQLPPFPLESAMAYSTWCTLIHGVLQQASVYDILSGVSHMPVQPHFQNHVMIPANVVPINTYCTVRQSFRNNDGSENYRCC